MQTTALMIQNLCVPCPCHCRYCLLCSHGRSTGVDYARGKAYARRFAAWTREHRSDLRVWFNIGYCMETPHIADYLAFTRELGCPWSDFLQLDGLAFRSDAEMAAHMRLLHDNGVRAIDLTFYGLEAYHDRFAGRSGDFAHLMQVLRCALDAGVAVDAGFPITQENTADAPALLQRLQAYPLASCRVFLPHSKGRGAAINHLRLTRQDFSALPASVRACFGARELRTEAEWIARGDYPQSAVRTLMLSLNEEDMPRLEQADFAQVIAGLEALDDAWRAAMPAPQELARLYGDAQNQQLFPLRDLIVLWQQRYTREHPGVYDMHDQRRHVSL